MPKKPRITSSYDSRIRKVEVVDQPRETLATFIKKYNAEQQALRDAPIRKLQDEYNTTLLDAQNRVKKFWSQSVAEIKEFPVSAYPIDPIGDYPTSDEGINLDEDARRAAFYQVHENLKKVRVELGTDGWIKLGLYARGLSFHRKAALTPEMLQQALERLVDLDCLSGEVVSGELPKCTKAAKPVDTTIEKELPAYLDSLHSEDPRSKAHVNREFAKTIQLGYFAFEEQCRQQFKDHFTTEEIQAMSRLLTSRNLNGTSPKGWHEARVLAVRAGYVRDKFLNADEQLAWDVDRGLVDTNSFEGRRAFNRRVSEIHKGTALLG